MTNIDVDSVEMRIIQALDKIRPYIQRDGGDVRLVEYKDGTVYLKFYGACVGCMMIGETLSGGIEATLKDEIPEISEVVMVGSEDAQKEINDSEVEANV